MYGSGRPPSALGFLKLGTLDQKNLDNSQFSCLDIG
jgi:hypothetical protein